MDNREIIISKALELFASQGYDAVGVQEIVKESGVTKPTLYYYFGSKEGLLKEILRIYSGKLFRIIKGAASYNHDLPLTLNRTTMAYFGFAGEYPQFYRFLLSLWFAPPDSTGAKVVEEFLQEQFVLIEEMFRLASLDHGNMKGRHRRYAVSFMGMINSYVGLSFRSHVELNNELTYQVVHQFMHGIYS